jgi:hypothetical protein
MTLLLVILSVLAVWALLGLLVFGLLFILSALQGVRRHLEKIAMGVRAIEKQARPLGSHADAAAVALLQAGDAGDRLAERLAETGRQLDAAGTAPGRRG